MCGCSINFDKQNRMLKRHPISIIGHKMLKNLTKMLSCKYQSQIDNFISEKNPQSVAEVEYWIRQYEMTKGKLYYAI